MSSAELGANRALALADDTFDEHEFTEAVEAAVDEISKKAQAEVRAAIAGMSPAELFDPRALKRLKKRVFREAYAEYRQFVKPLKIFLEGTRATEPAPCRYVPRAPRARRTVRRCRARSPDPPDPAPGTPRLPRHELVRGAS